MWSRHAVAAASMGTAAVLAHALPSVTVLGTFAPSPPAVLPAGWCRWRWPASGAAGALALTFDDGPDPLTTPRTLDLLDELGLRATFFLVGGEVDRYPALAAEIAGRGHGVAVHGHGHRHHLLRSPGWVCADTALAVAAVGRATGVVPRWYRPPYGQTSIGTVRAAQRHGLQVVLWSRWGREFAERSAGPVLERLRPGLVAGGVLLLHDSDRYARPGTAALTHQVLRPLAGELARRQLVSVPLDELDRRSAAAEAA